MRKKIKSRNFNLKQQKQIANYKNKSQGSKQVSRTSIVKRITITIKIEMKLEIKTKKKMKK